MRIYYLSSIIFVILFSVSAFAQVQSHPISQITPFDVNLNVTGVNITNVSYVFFGNGSTDTYLYRSGTNTLQTASTFIVPTLTLGWGNLTSFPSGCPAGQAVVTIGTSLTCGSAGGGWNTSGSYLFNNSAGVTVGINTSTPQSQLEIVSGNKVGALNVTAGNGSTLFYVNGSSGGVGIGTILPNATLHIVGSENITNGNLSFAGVNVGLLFPDGTFQTGAPTNVSQLYGNNGTTWVGLNTTSNGVLRLNVLDSVTNTWSTSGNYVYISGPSTVGINDSTPQSQLEIISGNKVGALNITNGAGTSVLYVNGSSGAVGIGTSSPGTLAGLNVTNGNVSFAGTNAGILWPDNSFQSGVVNTSQLYGNNGTTWVGLNTTSNGVLRLNVLDSVTNTWSTSGNYVYISGPSTTVGIGTTNPVKTLEVVGTINATQAVTVGSANVSTGAPNLVLNSDFGRRNKWMTFMPEVFADTSAWTAINGTLGTVSSNNLTAGSSGNWRAAWNGPNSMWRDARWSAQVKNTAQNGLVRVEKYVDANNYVACEFDTTGSTGYVVKNIAGTRTLSSTFSVTNTLNNWYWLELEAQGTTYICKVYTSGASPVAKSSATLAGTQTLTVSDSAVTSGGIAIFSSMGTASQWDGLSTGDGGVYVEGWGPESVSAVWQGTLGGQAFGFNESTDAGPLGKQSTLLTYIPAASRGIELDLPSTGAGGAPSTIKPSTAYTLSTYEKVSGLGGTGAILWEYVREQASDGSAVAYSAAINDAGETSYTRKTATATTASNTRMHFVTLGVNYDRQAASVKSATGTLFIDLTQLEEGSAVTPWRNAPQDFADMIWVTGSALTNPSTGAAGDIEIDPRDTAGNFFFPSDGVARIDVYTPNIYQTTAGQFFQAGALYDGSRAGGMGAYQTEPNANQEFTVTWTAFVPITAGKHRITGFFSLGGGTGTVIIRGDSGRWPELRVGFSPGKVAPGTQRGKGN